MKITVVLPNIRSAWNIGSIFRTCDALGFEIILAGYTARPVGSSLKLIQKTAIGAENSVNWQYFEHPSEILQTFPSNYLTQHLGIEINQNSQSLYEYLSKEFAKVNPNLPKKSEIKKNQDICQKKIELDKNFLEISKDSKNKNSIKNDFENSNVAISSVKLKEIEEPIIENSRIELSKKENENLQIKAEIESNLPKLFTNYNQILDKENIKRETEKIEIISTENTQSFEKMETEKLESEYFLWFGNEITGLEAQVLESLDAVLHLPMKGSKESLNIANCVTATGYLFDFAQNNFEN